jgi:hypothetical protein
MDSATPTRVVLYAHGSGTPVPAAEFVYQGDQGDQGVRMRVLDEVWSAVARDFFEHGVPSLAQDRQVLAAEGGAFMEALLEPRSMSYYSFVDSSGDAPGDDRVIDSNRG